MCCMRRLSLRDVCVVCVVGAGYVICGERAVCCVFAVYDVCTERVLCAVCVMCCT